MKDSTLTINPLAACQLLIQEMGESPASGQSLPESFESLNALRIAKQWPMATSMSCFNPKIPALTFDTLGIDLKPQRAYWQKGLTLILKHDRYEGVAQMLACCKHLAELPGDHCLSQISRVLIELLPLMGLTDVDILIELAGRFDKCLREGEHLSPIPSEELLRDCLFYLCLKKPEDFPQAWIWDDQGVLQLQLRLRWHAKQFSDLLYPTQDTDKINKDIIERNLAPLTDALLFLGETQLRTRLILRLDKIEERMLKFAVPVQVLMAEALRLRT